MASTVYRVREIRVEDEASLAENAESPSSNTFGSATHIPARDCTMTIGQDRIRDTGYRARVNDESLSNLSVKYCALEFTTNLTCHIGTTTGSLTASWPYNLLKSGLGGGSAAMTGTTVSAATTASSFTLTSTSGLAVGMIGRIGAKGDGRADGQAYVCSAVGAPTTSLVALPGTPQNTDVAYAGLQAYHDESTMSSLTTKRFLVGWPTSPTAGMQFQLLGMQLAGVKFTFPVDGTLPSIRWSYRGVYWNRSAATIPGSIAQESHSVKPVAGGSLCVQATGTATRTTQPITALELDLDLGLEPSSLGPGGAGTYQHITGWQRLGCRPMLRLRVPWTTAWETYWNTVNGSLVNKQILFLTNTVDGNAFAFYMPNAIPHGNVPLGPEDENQQAYVDVNLLGVDSTVTTSELTRSAIRFAFL